MRPRFSAFLIPIVLCVATLARAQGTDWSKVEIKTETLRGGVSVLFGAGGNIGVLTYPDGVFLVDDEFAPLTPKIQAAVRALSDQPVRVVLNTHWHGDHVGGNENFAKAGAILIAHENVRFRMMKGQVSKFFGRTTPPAPAAALPIVSIWDQKLWFGDEVVHAVPVAHAHTDGDLILHFEKANVVHMGDTFFNGFYPIIDLESGGSIDGMIAAVDKALPWMDEGTKVIAGHGPTSDKAGVIEYRAMLAGIRDAIGPLVKKKKSLAEVQALKPTAPWDAKWGGGYLKPDRFVELVYNDLSRR